MSDHVVAGVDEIPDGERKVVEVAGREIAVFNVGGTYQAYRNQCLHQSGPVCQGRLTGTYDGSFDRDKLQSDRDWVREGEILSCPWHGWEYDITTGDCLSRERGRLKAYAVRTSNGDVILEL